MASTVRHSGPIRSALLAVVVALFGCVSCSSSDQTVDANGGHVELEPTVAPADRDTNRTASAPNENPESAPESSRKRSYEECLLSRGFDPGGVQVLINKAGKPWWVKTGRDVPAEIHGPCMEEIGGMVNGLSSWGSLVARYRQHPSPNAGTVPRFERV